MKMISHDYRFGGAPKAPALKRSLIVAGVMVTALAVAGCQAHKTPLHTASIPKTSIEDRHPIKLAGDAVRHDILVGPKRGHLNRKDRDHLTVYVNGYLKNGGGPLLVRVPTGTVNAAASLQALSDVREVFDHVHLDPRTVNIVEYTPHGRAGTPYPIVLSYQVYQTVLPECGYITDNLSDTRENQPSDNFGCATQRNLGLMVSNPSDLRVPRHRTPSDMQRRSTVFDDYRSGEDPSTQPADDSSGTVSEVAE